MLGSVTSMTLWIPWMGGGPGLLALSPGGSALCKGGSLTPMLKLFESFSPIMIAGTNARVKVS